jgi:hypothetical protein
VAPRAALRAKKSPGGAIADCLWSSLLSPLPQNSRGKYPSVTVNPGSVTIRIEKLTSRHPECT